MTCRFPAKKKEIGELTSGDRVQHRFNFDMMQSEEVFSNLSISEQCICLLKKVSTDQRATVLTDVEIDECESARGNSGNKYRDFSSSLLFTVVHKSATEKVIGILIEKGLGTELSDEKRDCMSNLRFVDDVIMLVTSLKEVKRMIVDLKTSAEKHTASKFRQ